jgi:hypothetical protein
MTSVPPSSMEMVTAMVAAAPFLRLLDVPVPQMSVVDDEFVARVAVGDVLDLHNHAGAPHAGALFTVGITASVAVVTCALHQLFDVAAPLVAGADTDFRRPCTGAVEAVARMPVDSTGLAAAAAAGQRARFTVPVTIGAPGAEPAAAMTVRWLLRPHRR